jgi:hypothetical protein
MSTRLERRGLGILSWTFDSNGVIATNDIGTVDVTLTNNSDLTLAPYAVSVDTNGNIYTIQRNGQRFTTNDTNPKGVVLSASSERRASRYDRRFGKSARRSDAGQQLWCGGGPTATFVAVASRRLRLTAMARRPSRRRGEHLSGDRRLLDRLHRPGSRGQHQSGILRCGLGQRRQFIYVYGEDGLSQRLARLFPARLQPGHDRRGSLHPSVQRHYAPTIVAAGGQPGATELHAHGPKQRHLRHPAIA